jgi:ribokinase
MKKHPKVAVVGSINMDLVTKTERFPKRGETVLGTEFNQYPGGKGANQAVAASRLGAEVSFIGCVGNDSYGEQLKQILEGEGIDIEGIDVCSNVQTGIAQITVAEKENSIIVVPGANHELTTDWVQTHCLKLSEADIILVQLETPLPIAEVVVEIANEYNVPVILNPAPAQHLKNSLVSKISYLTPNESEICTLTSGEESDLAGQIQILLKRGVSTIILTRGEDGVLFNQGDKLEARDSMKVQAVDTTGAGDTFNGALAVGLARGDSLNDAVELAVKAASISVTKPGAQSGMPHLHELKQYSI